MKKLSIALVVAALLALTAATASADTYSFEDMIDYWTLDLQGNWHAAGPTQELGESDAARISQGNPLSYTHDINQEVNLLAGDQVIEAYLELDFTNADLFEDGDDYGSFWIFEWDYREFVRVAYDGSGWIEIGEQGDGQYDLALDINWLNDNGMLDVTVAVHNPLGTADIWLDHSRVYGVAQVVPVPGAVLLGVLGLSAAGIKLRKNRAA